MSVGGLEEEYDYNYHAVEGAGENFVVPRKFWLDSSFKMSFNVSGIILVFNFQF